MALTIKEKGLVFVSASVSAGCKPCTSYHYKKVKEAGASDIEIKQAISDAMCVRNSAKEIMEAHGLKKIGIVKGVDDCGCDDTSRIKELVSIAASYAVNCTSNLEKHISAAQTVNITDDEIISVIKSTEFIKSKAVSHVDRIVEKIGNGIFTKEKTKETNGCDCDNSEDTTIESKKETVTSTGKEEDCGCDEGC